MNINAATMPGGHFAIYRESKIMGLNNLTETPGARFKEDVSGVYEHIIRYRAKMNLAADESETP